MPLRKSISEGWLQDYRDYLGFVGSCKSSETSVPDFPEVSRVETKSFRQSLVLVIVRHFFHFVSSSNNEIIVNICVNWSFFALFGQTRQPQHLWGLAARFLVCLIPQSKPNVSNIELIILQVLIYVNFISGVPMLILDQIHSKPT